MEVPSPDAGKIVDIKISLGDQVSKGDSILEIEFEEIKAGKKSNQSKPSNSNESKAIQSIPIPDLGDAEDVEVIELCVKVGDKVISGSKKEIRNGNCMPMSDIPVGIDIHNIELKSGSGAQLARSAGTSTQIVGKSNGYVAIKLPSGEQRKIREECRATIGVLSNIDKKNQKLGKAGRNRWLGIRPSVRGVAMNPIDHPHGGGEGKTSGGRDPVTPWGKPTKGKKTRNNKRTDKFIIKRKTDKKARIEV